MKTTVTATTDPLPFDPALIAREAAMCYRLLGSAPAPATAPATPTEAQLARDRRWAKRQARRARRIARDQATWRKGQQARAERIDANPGEIAARFAEQQ